MAVEKRPPSRVDSVWQQTWNLSRCYSVGVVYEINRPLKSILKFFLNLSVAVSKLQVAIRKLQVAIRCIKLFVSTEGSSSHEFASQFGLEIFYAGKTPKNHRENRIQRKCPSLSVTVRHCPSLSVTVRHCPSLSVTVRHCPSLSVTVRHCPSLSVTVRHCPSLSVTVRHCPSLSVTVRHCPSLSVTVRHCPSLSVTVRHCPSQSFLATIKRVTCRVHGGN